MQVIASLEVLFFQSPMFQSSLAFLFSAYVPLFRFQHWIGTWGLSHHLDCMVLLDQHFYFSQAPMLRPSLVVLFFASVPLERLLYRIGKFGNLRRNTGCFRNRWLRSHQFHSLKGFLLRLRDLIVASPRLFTKFNDFIIGNSSFFFHMITSISVNVIFV